MSVRVEETVWIMMPDGVHLAARIWFPETEQPMPAILEYIPYRRRDSTRMRDEGMHPRLAQAGYVAIRVDMRGSGDSDGVMLDEYSDQEIQDGVDVIAWIADQPWCDGSVGMFGKSWGAYTSFQVAARRPPALKAIAPVMGTDDRWLEDIHFYGGVLANDNFWWGSIMQFLNALPPDPDIVGKDRWRDLWKERLDAMTYWPAQWLEHQTRDAMWDRGSISVNYEDVQVPVYFFGGWADLFRDTPFRIAEHLKGSVKVLMGPWAHLYPHDGIPGPRVDFVAEIIRWWDHWLKDADTGIVDEPPLRFWLPDSVPPKGYYDERPGRWVEEPCWPSPNVADQALWLNATGLSGDADTIGAPLSICSPANYGAASGDMCSFAIAGDMPADCRVDAGGALSFGTQPLKTDLDILGQPRLALTVSTDQPAGFVAVLLADEAPDGAQTLITRGFANLMHRDGPETPKPVIPGEEMEITVPLHGIGYRLLAGHRLVVHVSSSYWPILWPSPDLIRLTLRPGTSALHLPIRTTSLDAPEPRSLPLPPETEPAKFTAVSEGHLERGWTMDATSGVQTQRVFIDGGVFGPVGRVRLNETGTEMGGVSERLYQIGADPLSARAVMIQSDGFKRGDWRPHIETYAEMTATRTHFVLKAHVECRNGEEHVHHVDWHHEIPRNGM